MPKPGRIKIYTSGWPKNQNKCWYSTGSPPPAQSKNAVLKLDSVLELDFFVYFNFFEKLNFSANFG